MKKILILSSILFFTFLSAFAQKDLIGSGQIGGTLALKKNDNVWVVVEAEIVDTEVNFTATDDLARVKSIKVKHPKKGWQNLERFKKRNASTLKKTNQIKISGTPGINWKVEEGEAFILEVAGLKDNPDGYYQYKLKNVKILDQKRTKNIEEITLGYTEVEWTYNKGYTDAGRVTY